MAVLTIVRVIAVVCNGVIAGIYLGYFATAPARGALTAASFVQYEQVVHAYYGKLLPALIIAGVLATVIWLLIIKSQRKAAEFWLVAASFVGILLIVGITRALNVPLNNELMTWSAAAPPANLKEIWEPWERANAIRAIVAMGVFVLQTVALALMASNKPS